MNTSQFIATGDQDTQVIPAVQALANTETKETSAAQRKPVWRRITALGVTSVLFLASTALLVWFEFKNTSSKHEEFESQSLAVYVVFAMTLAALGCALFRDFNERRHSITEKLIRDLMGQMHHETRATARAMHEDTVHRVKTMIGETSALLIQNRGEYIRRMEAMNQRTLAEVATLNQEQLERVGAEHATILQAMLALEKVMPELLAQLEWVSIAKGIRTSMEDGTWSDASDGRRYPNPSPTRTRTYGPLRAVPDVPAS